MSRVACSSRVPNGVQERLIAALVPDVAQPRDLAAVAPLPLLPALRRLGQAGSVELMVGTARMDHSGRVCERILLRALGWASGQRLEMDTMHGMIIVAADRHGRHVVDSRGALGLPAALRRLCGIQPGPPLVLAAASAPQVLVIHPAAVVAELLAAHYTDLIGAAL